MHCSDHLKIVMQRSIGPLSGCYSTAPEFVEALANPPAALKPKRISSLKGRAIVFTGALSMPRAHARTLAGEAGATVKPRVSDNVDVIVMGDPSAHFGAGSRGRKLIEYERLLSEGHSICLIDEARFLKLVGQAPSRLAGPR